MSDYTTTHSRKRTERDTNGRRRILYIYPATLGPSTDPKQNPLHYLSRYLEGDYLALWIVQNAEEARARRVEVQRASGRFGFHYIRRRQLPRPLQRLMQFWFYVGKGIGLTLKHGRYDAIVAYGPFTTGLAGLVIGRLTRARVIIEFPGHPFKSFDLYPGWLSRAKRLVAPRWADWMARKADRVRLLYPWQLADLPTDLSATSSTFHNFTTVASTPPPEPNRSVGTSRFVLFVGFPFHLKGVDILIRAFKRISPNHPDVRLLVVGHCPDPGPYQKLAGETAQIEIHKPVSHPEVLDLMARCEMFVLPSRIEAMGRVLLEARAAGRPVIAAAVGGVPHYVEHEKTGLLFEPENVGDLAAQMARLLDDPAYAEQLGRQGRDFVMAELNEERYAMKFREMIDATLADGPGAAGAPAPRLNSAS